MCVYICIYKYWSSCLLGLHSKTGKKILRTSYFENACYVASWGPSGVDPARAQVCVSLVVHVVFCRDFSLWGGSCLGLLSLSLSQIPIQWDFIQGFSQASVALQAKGEAFPLGKATEVAHWLDGVCPNMSFTDKSSSSCTAVLWGKVQGWKQQSRTLFPPVPASASPW